VTQTLFGTWWNPEHPDQRWSGKLTWEPPHAPELELLDAPFHTGFGQEQLVPMLLGRVDRVGYITLLGCRSWGARYGAGTTGNYRINHVLTGLHLTGPAERFVRRVELEVPALALVLGGRPVDFGHIPTSRTRTMRVKVDRRRLVWKDDEVEIEFQYIWNVRHGELGLDITMSPQVYLSSRKSQPFDWWFTQWLVPLSQLIQVMSGEMFRAKRVGLWMKKGITRMERAAERIDVWQSGTDPEATVDFRSSERRQVPPLVTGHQLALLPLLEVLRSGRRDSQHEVFSGLTASAMIYRDRPLRNRYLDAITAIEAHDYTEHGEGPVERTTFKERRTAALSGVTDPAAKLFVNRWMQRRSSFSLEQRLERTRTAPRLNWEQSAGTMAQLRNDIAHGNAHPDSWSLEACFHQALLAARLLALNDVGAYADLDDGE
jgi:ApeA N-terminal domain 1